MKLTKMVYLCTPYSDPKKLIRDMRKKQAEKIGAELQAKYGYAFIHPIVTSARLCEARPDLLLGGDFKHWENVDLTFISRCDEIWIICLKGWSRSIGVCAEIEFAENQVVHIGAHSVRYLNPETLKFITRKRALKLEDQDNNNSIGNICKHSDMQC